MQKSLERKRLPQTGLSGRIRLGRMHFSTLVSFTASHVIPYKKQPNLCRVAYVAVISEKNRGGGGLLV